MFFSIKRIITRHLHCQFCALCFDFYCLELISHAMPSWLFVKKFNYTCIKFKVNDACYFSQSF